MRKNALIVFIYLLIVWGFYRFRFNLPQEIEEVIIKPILWLFPVFYFLKKEKAKIASLGLTRKNLFASVGLSLGLGAVFFAEGLVLNYLKYQGFNLALDITALAFAISWVTAFCEELVFRGYIFTRLWQGFKNELFANFLTAGAWVTIHIPVSIFVLRLDLEPMLIFLVLTGIFSLGSSFLFARTKNIFGSVILHVLWQWPIILFR